MAKSKNPFADIENNVSAGDLTYYREQLKKPSKVGSYAIWICMLVFAVMGWILTDYIIDDTPLYHPWYSRLPLIGSKLWSPPNYTNLPVIGQKIHDSGLIKFFGLFGGFIIGYYIGKFVVFCIGNGAKQNLKNKQKLERF